MARGEWVFVVSLLGTYFSGCSFCSWEGRVLMMLTERYSKALVHLARVGESRMEECIQLIVKHGRELAVL